MAGVCSGGGVGLPVSSRTAFDCASLKTPASDFTCSSQRNTSSTADRIASAAAVLSSVSLRSPRRSPSWSRRGCPRASPRCSGTRPSPIRWWQLRPRRGRRPPHRRTMMNLSSSRKVAVAVFRRSESATGRPSFTSPVTKFLAIILTGDRPSPTRCFTPATSVATLLAFKSGEAATPKIEPARSRAIVHCSWGGSSAHEARRRRGYCRASRSSGAP